MAARLLPSAAEMKKLADYVNSEGVTVALEYEGRVFRVSPYREPKAVDDNPESDLDRELDAFKVKHGYR